MNQTQQKEDRARRMASLFVAGCRDRVELKRRLDCYDATLYRLLDDPEFVRELKRQNYKGPIEFIRRKPGRKVS